MVSRRSVGGRSAPVGPGRSAGERAAGGVRAAGSPVKLITVLQNNRKSAIIIKRSTVGTYSLLYKLLYSWDWAVALAAAVAVAAVAMSVTNMPIAHYHLEDIDKENVFCGGHHRDMHPLK